MARRRPTRRARPARVTRTAGLLCAGALVVGAAGPAAASSAPDVEPLGGDGPATLGLIGDFLYFEEQVDDAQRMLADLDDADLDLVVHDGDTTYAPVTPFRCSEQVLAYHVDALNDLDTPVLYTPGDNEWSDCPAYPERYGAENVGYTDPLVALDAVRGAFFPSSQSLGADPVELEVQSEEFPENRRTTVAGVPVATMHVVGSLNGYETLELAPALAEEIPARTDAAIAWLGETFDEAERTDAPGVMLVWHGNPDPYTPVAWEAELDTPRPELWDDAYAGLLAALRAEVTAFGKPVVLVHGDSHFQRIDHPLAVEPGSGYTVPNFTRVETFGTPNHHWLRATIDPEDPDVFAFEQVLVEGNTAPPETTTAR